MALHGEVKVNRDVVAWWSATRVRGGTNPDDINHYQCEVGRAPTRQGLVWSIWHGTVEHRYGDGAIGLAAAVLAAATGDTAGWTPPLR